MDATVLDMRRNTKEILDALERNETVILSKRGREIARIVPMKRATPATSLTDLPAFGMWKGRTDMADPSAYVRRMRKGRFGDI